MKIGLADQFCIVWAQGVTYHPRTAQAYPKFKQITSIHVPNIPAERFLDEVLTFA